MARPGKDDGCRTRPPGLRSRADTGRQGWRQGHRLTLDAEGASETYVVELKHWRAGGQVGKGTVREFIEVVARETHSGGLMLASGGYSGDASSALAELEHRTVRLGGRSKIVSLCKTYVKAERGLWSPTALTAVDTLFDSTLGTADG
jgi:restriction system protein